MASPAHALYCFDVLSAKLTGGKQHTLDQIEYLYSQYLSSQNSNSNGNHNTHTTPTSNGHADSKSSHPMFITWNTLHPHHSRSSSHRLRGCIGTFAAQPLPSGLSTYALTSALEDHRFNPISAAELPSLHCDVTLLTDFEDIDDPLDWEVGVHGLRISFHARGRRYGSTYLPQVAREQGWGREETVESLMRKAGWSGKARKGKRPWEEVEDMKVVRYQGRAVGVEYEEWREFREWVDEREGA